LEVDYHRRREEQKHYVKMQALEISIKLPGPWVLVREEGKPGISYTSVFGGGLK
jgi:hypothetical protein